MSTPDRSTLRFAASLVFGLLLMVELSGCARRVRIEDRETIGGGGRVVLEVVPAKGENFGWTGVTLDGELAYRQGESDDTVPDGRTIDNRGNTIGLTAGDVAYEGRAKVIEATGLIRTGVHFKKMVRVEAMTGGQVIGSDVTLTGDGVQTSSNESAAGAVVGVRVGVQPHEMIEFYGTTLVGMPSGSRGLTTSERWDAGVRFMPVDYLGLYAVYRQTRYERERSDSDIKIDFSGPIFGLEFRFDDLFGLGDP